MKNRTAEYDGNDPSYKLFAPAESNGYWHVLAMVDERTAGDIVLLPFEIGLYTFVPGELYPRFGSKRKTSAGYIHYDGEPLRFEGTYQDNALFTRAGQEDAFTLWEFPVCFFSWVFDRKLEIFLSFTNRSAGRVMEMGVK